MLNGVTKSSRRVVLERGLALEAAGFVGDVVRVGVEDDAALAGERDEALALGAADEREIGLARELDSPGGEARARDQDRDLHLHGLEHHLAGEPPGGVEDLARR